MAKRRNLSTEEADLWRRAMRSTKPLPGVRLPDPPKAPARPVQKMAEVSAQPHKAPSLTHRPSLPLRPNDPFANGLDGSTARRIRRGRMDVEGTIDLHGMRQHEAHDALIRFVMRSADRGKRCILVITGKGGRQRGHEDDAAYMTGGSGDGILRRQLPMWLRQEPLRSRIFALETAHQKDGGSGAFYVFLKRS